MTPLRTLLLLSSLALPSLVHAGDGSKVQGNYPERMNWWLDARFGMFIHWDKSSVTGFQLDENGLLSELTPFLQTRAE